MDKKFKIALIGCGAISQTHINSLEEIDICDIKTACDIDDTNSCAKANKYGYSTCRDYNEVLSDNDIDAVHILTPHNLHTPIAIKALEAGKHVLLEKPVGISLDEIRKIKEAEKKSAGKIGVVFQNRYNNTSIKMKEIINNSELGDFRAVKAIVAWHRNSDYYNKSKWRGKLETEGGGLLINQAIHTLDLMRYLGGDIVSLKGHVQNTAHDYIEVEDAAMATLYYKNGAIGSFYGTNNHGINSKIELELVFEKGNLRLLDDKLYFSYKNETKVVAEDIIQEGAKSYWGLSHTACIKAFYKSLSENEEVDISLEDAAITNEIVLGIYESSKTNKKYCLMEEQK